MMEIIKMEIPVQTIVGTMILSLRALMKDSMEWIVWKVEIPYAMATRYAPV